MIQKCQENQHQQQQLLMREIQLYNLFRDGNVNDNAIVMTEHNVSDAFKVHEMEVHFLPDISKVSTLTENVNSQEAYKN